MKQNTNYRELKEQELIRIEKEIIARRRAKVESEARTNRLIARGEMLERIIVGASQMPDEQIEKLLRSAFTASRTQQPDGYDEVEAADFVIIEEWSASRINIIKK